MPALDTVLRLLARLQADALRCSLDCSMQRLFTHLHGRATPGTDLLEPAAAVAALSEPHQQLKQQGDTQGAQRWQEVRSLLSVLNSQLLYNKQQYDGPFVEAVRLAVKTGRMGEICEEALASSVVDLTEVKAMGHGSIEQLTAAAHAITTVLARRLHLPAHLCEHTNFSASRLEETDAGCLAAVETGRALISCLLTYATGLIPTSGVWDSVSSARHMIGRIFDPAETQVVVWDLVGQPQRTGVGGEDYLPGQQSHHIMSPDLAEGLSRLLDVWLNVLPRIYDTRERKLSIAMITCGEATKYIIPAVDAQFEVRAMAAGNPLRRSSAPGHLVRCTAVFHPQELDLQYVGKQALSNMCAASPDGVLGDAVVRDMRSKPGCEGFAGSPYRGDQFLMGVHGLADGLQPLGLCPPLVDHAADANGCLLRLPHVPPFATFMSSPAYQGDAAGRYKSRLGNSVLARARQRREKKAAKPAMLRLQAQREAAAPAEYQPTAAVEQQQQQQQHDTEASPSMELDVPCWGAAGGKRGQKGGFVQRGEQVTDVSQHPWYASLSEKPAQQQMDEGGARPDRKSVV